MYEETLYIYVLRMILLSQKTHFFRKVLTFLRTFYIEIYSNLEYFTGMLF